MPTPTCANPGSAFVNLLQLSQGGCPRWSQAAVALSCALPTDGMQCSVFAGGSGRNGGKMIGRQSEERGA
eukprot:13443266-Alexandrium_andersonii.AAC.1